MLEKAFRQEGQDLTEKALKGGLKKLKADSVQDLHFSVGTGHTSALEVVRAVYPGTKERSGWRKVVSIGRSKSKRDKVQDQAIPIKGLIPGMALHYAHCCHPLPGDRIVGIVTTGKGVTVHTIDCDTLQTFAETPERWVDLAWDVDGSSVPFLGRLHVVVANEPGSLGNLSTVIGKNDGNISNLKITNRSIDFFEMLIDVEVKDLKHLTDIMAALRAMSVITSVERART